MPSKRGSSLIYGFCERKRAGIQSAVEGCIGEIKMKQIVQAIEILKLVVEESQDIEEVVNALVKINVLEQALEILRGEL